METMEEGGGFVVPVLAGLTQFTHALSNPSGLHLHFALTQDAGRKYKSSCPACLLPKYAYVLGSLLGSHRPLFPQTEKTSRRVSEA